MPARLGRSLRVTSDERITAPGSQRVWRSGPRCVLTKAGGILLSGLVTAWGLGYVWRSLGANGPTALVLSSIALLLFVGFFGWLWVGISAASLVVTDDTVSLVRRGVSLRAFVRADTVFGSRVLRTFLNGVPGTGEQRSLTATAGCR